MGLHMGAAYLLPRKDESGFSQHGSELVSEVVSEAAPNKQQNTVCTCTPVSDRKATGRGFRLPGASHLQYGSPARIRTAASSSLHFTHFLETL